MVMRKTLIPRVQPGVLLVRTSFLRSTRELIREDFPTFDRPAKATSANAGGGSSRVLRAEVMNRASVTRGVMAYSVSAPSPARKQARELAHPEQLCRDEERQRAHDHRDHEQEHVRRGVSAARPLRAG